MAGQSLLYPTDAVSAVQNQVYELQSVCDICLLVVQAPDSAAYAVCCCCCALDAFEELLRVSTCELK